MAIRKWRRASEVEAILQHQALFRPGRLVLCEGA